MDHAARTGLFGGTFDPPHLGHIVVATEARYRLGLDELLLVVANDPWQKSADTGITPAQIRLEMVQAAVADHPALLASDIEIRRGGPSYTVDTVEQLSPGTGELTLVMGADTAAGLATWHRNEELASMVRIAVAARSGATPRLGPDWRVSTFTSPTVDVSSSEIRRRCREGEPIDHLVAPGVLAVIEAHGLYDFRR